MTTIGPILPGRLPATLTAARLSQNIQRAYRVLQQLQDQAATGQKFFIPSESPGAAARTIALQKTLERQTQLKVNLTTDKSLLAASETALNTVGDALIQAKAFLLAGVGNTSSPAEKLAMADEVAGLIQGVVNAGNTTFRGRYLFGGSEATKTPFEIIGNGLARYNGDARQNSSFIDFDLTVANNLDGVTAFNALTPAAGSSVNPALTPQTRLSDLLGGAGVSLGPITVTVDNGGPVTQTVDLTHADTIADVKTLIENAFPPGTLTVGIAATPGGSGLTITASAGTVAVSDQPGATVARDLGIASGPAATITGGDLDPRLTLQTPLSAFNNGAGATNGSGLFITNGTQSKAVDISSANTVEDLFNVLKAADLDLDLRINDAGDGLAISSRLSGAAFGIGENGGTDAASLGIRTLTGSTLLAGLNSGLGVPVNETDVAGTPLPAIIEITRRDGSTTQVDLKGLTTVQDAIDAINAVDANLSASLNSVGNGISITDTSGTGPLEVNSGAVADALGLTGVEPGSDNTVPLAGSDVNQSRSTGVLSLLLQLETALRTGDDRTLERLDKQFDAEIGRLNSVRGGLGTRLKLLESVENRLLDQDVSLQEQLSQEFDADLVDVVSRTSKVQAVLQATLQISSSTLNLSLFSYL
jgi:flagellar hook-associated protein 3 FlgL